jgi:hypothetical protein
MMFALEKSHPQDFHVMIALREHPNIRVAAAKRITWTPPKSDP